MSIPLDQLYHFLSNIVNQDTLIYRWDPHGSKKLKDLSLLDARTWRDAVLLPPIICHDQEPLGFESYSRKDYFDFMLAQDAKGDRSLELKIFSKIMSHPDFQNAVPPGLRGVTVANIHNRPILLHSELNSHQVACYAKKRFYPVYYWCHGIISRDWFRYAEHDPIILNKSVAQIKKDFLIYNRAWSGSREYRLKFIELLVSNGLHHKAKVSFSPIDNNMHYTKHKFNNPELSITDSKLDSHLPLNTTPSSYSANCTSIDYTQTGIEVVLETLFDDQRWHLTEKILRPIACRHPFILVSTKGSLKYLKLYGFETFEKFIDESYDDIDHPVERLNAVIAEMTRISSLPESDRIKLFDQLWKISKRNQMLFFSDKFFQAIVGEFLQNINIALDDIKSDHSAKDIKQLFDFVEQHFPEDLGTVFQILSDGIDLREFLKEKNIT